MVNIFTDLYYLTFVQELNKSLSGWQPTILPNSMCLQCTFCHCTYPVCASSLGSSSLILLPQPQPSSLGIGSTVPLCLGVVLTHTNSGASLVYASAASAAQSQGSWGARAWLLCILGQLEYLQHFTVMSPSFGKEDTKPGGNQAHAFVFPAHGQALHPVLSVGQGCHAAAL